MSCQLWSNAIIESARANSAPEPALRDHLSLCPDCNRRWQNQRVLSAQLRTIRDAAVPRHPTSLRREQVMRQFGVYHRRRTTLRWALAAAATVILAVGLSVDFRSRPSSSPTESVVVWDGSMDDFVAVPYAPPLATGEFLKVVHADLPPSDFARMGLDLEANDGSEVPADVMVGEDGFPRAVRLSRDETIF